MFKRDATQRHGESEPLLREGKEPSSLVAVNAVSEGSVAVVTDPEAASANTFAGPGKFGKIFPNATPFRPADKGLIELANAISEAPGAADAAGDSKIPAGFTYLGQFIDHDITFDKTVGMPVIDNLKTIRDDRTPNLDLDSMYGSGPGGADEQDPDKRMFEGTPGSEIFSVGRNSKGSGDGSAGVNFPNDLRRRADRSARIPDPRNDENLVVAQTHLAFLKFHNKVVASLLPSKPGEPSVFERAREQVTLHYQWIVLNDFLRRLVQPAVLDAVLKPNGRKFYLFETVGDKKPFMPVEFSVAAYRLGHSMIRASYDYNRVFTPNPGGLVPASLELLFTFSSGNTLPVPGDWIIDWRRFHEVGNFGNKGGFKGINRARKIDTRIADPLKLLLKFHKVDNAPSSLSERNLLRGSRLGLPTGQELSKLMGVAKPLTPAEVASGPTGAVVKKNAFDTQSPLWFYILKEAEVREKGERLGELGSRILAEVFVGLLQGDPNSFINKKWTPAKSKIPRKDPNNFTMADMLLFNADISPIDGIFG